VPRFDRHDEPSWQSGSESLHHPYKGARRPPKRDASKRENAGSLRGAQVKGVPSHASERRDGARAVRRVLGRSPSRKERCVEASILAGTRGDVAQAAPPCPPAIFNGVPEGKTGLPVDGSVACAPYGVRWTKLRP
jgi:hypothetical protein